GIILAGNFQQAERNPNLAVEAFRGSGDAHSFYEKGIEKVLDHRFPIGPGDGDNRAGILHSVGSCDLLKSGKRTFHTQYRKVFLRSSKAVGFVNEDVFCALFRSMTQIIVAVDSLSAESDE